MPNVVLFAKSQYVLIKLGESITIYNYPVSLLKKAGEKPN